MHRRNSEHTADRPAIERGPGNIRRADGIELSAPVKQYILDGSTITCLADFYREIGRTVNGPGGYFGRGLDDLADCLLGGMGTPDDEGFYVTWRNSALSRRALGHDETARVLQQNLARAHPANHKRIHARIDDARHQRGATLFDHIVDLFRERNVRLDLE